jgi:hypothetical protein
LRDLRLPVIKAERRPQVVGGSRCRAARSAGFVRGEERLPER